MNQAILGWLFALILAPSPGSWAAVGAVNLDVEVSSPGPVPSDIEVRAEPVGSADATALAPVQVRATGGTAKISLHPAVWQVTLRARGFWSSPRTVNLLSGPQRVAFRLWPTGTISGRMTVDAGPPPAAIQVTFVPAPVGGRFPRAPLGTAPCAIQGLEWRCEVPAARLDVKLAARGFVSHYLWDFVVAPARDAPTGPSTWHRGSSVVGRVGQPDGKPAGADCRVSLVTHDDEPLRAAGAKGAAGFFTTLVNARGFYQLADVPAGEYVVAAEGPGRARATAAISTIADTETSVDMLILHEPETLELVLDPPVHPSGEQWSVRLIGRAPTPGGIRHADLRVGRDGRVRRADLSPGAYRVTVRAQGAQWLTSEIEVRNSPVVRLEVPLHTLRGRVRLGGQPLKGRVTFGGLYGAVRVPFESNEEGEFGGLFPGAPDQTWEVAVEAASPPVMRTLGGVRPQFDSSGTDAEVTLELPQTVIKGNVVDESGHPVPNALVDCEPLSMADRLVQINADARGRFRFSGLPPGGARISAEAGKGTAGPVEIDLKDGVESAVTLTIRGPLTLTGRVVSSDGQGVAGATVKFYPKGIPLYLAEPMQRTDSDGAFRAELPPETSEVAVAVGARGFALRSVIVPLPATQPVTIRLAPLGGTLELDVGAIGSVSRSDARAPMVYVLHDGAAYLIDLLREWASVQGSGEHPFFSVGSSPTSLTIPQMAGGMYALCWATPTEGWTLAGGTLPAKRCAGGRLVEGDTLKLTLPAVTSNQ